MVEADQLFRIKPFDVSSSEGREQIGRIKLKNSLQMTQTFLDENFAHVIIEGLVWSQAELDAVADLRHKHPCEVYCFWLKTNKDVRHKRVITRKRDAADSQEFLDTIEKEIIDPTPLLLPEGHYNEISTDEMTADQVVQEIYRIIIS